jgi:hypothetical protein
VNQDQLKANLAQSATNYSTYAIVIFFGIATYWMQLPPSDQAALIAAYPLLKHAAPLAGLITYLSRILPQGNTPPAPAVHEEHDPLLQPTQPMDRP